MAIDFPGSPHVNDTFTSGTTTWTWDGAKWDAAPAGNWVEAPSDNLQYSRRNAAWTSNVIQGDAPNDGQAYRRVVSGGNMIWSPDPIVTDAPAAAGAYYGRVNATWGALSPTFTLKTYVDAQIAAALATAQALTNAISVPIGGIVMYGSPTPPAQFLNCDGTVYNISAAPALAAVIGNRFGGNGTTTFGVPNLGGRVPISTTIGAIGGAGSFSLAVANLPPHYHLVPAHAHGVSDPGHNHSQSGHGHGISDPGHQHSYAQATNFSLYGGPYPSTGSIALVGALTNPAYTGVTVQAQVANLNAAATGVTVASNGPWATDISYGQGSAAAVGLYPPYMGFNFIIRYY
jgi:microcystin-dependent protein